MGMNVARSNTRLVFRLREQRLPLLRGFRLGQTVASPGTIQPVPQGRRGVLLPVRQDATMAVLPGALSEPSPLGRQGSRAPQEARAQLRPRERAVGTGAEARQAGPDMVRPSTLLLLEPEFNPNPTRHPSRFPIDLPNLFIKLMTKPGQLVFDPFAGTCTTAVAAENLGPMARDRGRRAVRPYRPRAPEAGPLVGSRDVPPEDRRSDCYRRGLECSGRSSPTGS